MLKINSQIWKHYVLIPRERHEYQRIKFYRNIFFKDLSSKELNILMVE